LGRGRERVQVAGVGRGTRGDGLSRWPWRRRIFPVSGAVAPGAPSLAGGTRAAKGGQRPGMRRFLAARERGVCYPVRGVWAGRHMGSMGGPSLGRWNGVPVWGW
jgi:hypothetical protein